MTPKEKQELLDKIIAVGWCVTSSIHRPKGGKPGEALMSAKFTPEERERIKELTSEDFYNHNRLAQWSGYDWSREDVDKWYKEAVERFGKELFDVERGR